MNEILRNVPDHILEVELSSNDLYRWHLPAISDTVTITDEDPYEPEFKPDVQMHEAIIQHYLFPFYF